MYRVWVGICTFFTTGVLIGVCVLVALPTSVPLPAAVGGAAAAGGLGAWLSGVAVVTVSRYLRARAGGGRPAGGPTAL